MSQAAADMLVAEGDAHFRADAYSEALARYERAAQIFPNHALAWRGVGNALLRLSRPHDAARAFDRAIGLRPDSATALWGGALAHADLGNRVMAQTYLRRALELQPSWLEMTRGLPQLSALLQVSARAADAIRDALGAYAGKTYRHAADWNRAVEVGRLTGSPEADRWSYVTIGLSNTEWHHGQPRVELVMAAAQADAPCGTILGNLAFHLTDTGFYPEPGAVVRDVVGALGLGDLSTRLPHVFVTAPRAWGVLLPLDPGPPPITLAQIVPITEEEYLVWKREPGALEPDLRRRGVDVADLTRD